MPAGSDPQRRREPRPKARFPASCRVPLAGVRNWSRERAGRSALDGSLGKPAVHGRRLRKDAPSDRRARLGSCRWADRVAAGRHPAGTPSLAARRGPPSAARPIGRPGVAPPSDPTADLAARPTGPAAAPLPVPSVGEEPAELSGAGARRARSRVTRCLVERLAHRNRQGMRASRFLCKNPQPVPKSRTAFPHRSAQNARKPWIPAVLQPSAGRMGGTTASPVRAI